MTEQQFTRIWQKPMDKAKEFSNTHAPVLKGVGVSAWAKAVYEALEDQKAIKTAQAKV